MRTPSARTVFLSLAGLLIGCPLLGFFGLRGFVSLHGFEAPDRLPVRSVQAVLDGSFQRGAEAHFEHLYFGRKELLLLRNGVFDLANANQYHAGFAGHIIEGKDGFLFERPYIDVRNTPEARIHMARRDRFSAAIQECRTVRKALAARKGGAGIPTAFLLAPSKADVLADHIPDRFGPYCENTNAVSVAYRIWPEILRKAKVPFVEPADYLSDGSSPIADFPKQGTHWTVLCAGRALAAVQNRLPGADTAEFPFVAPTAEFRPGPDDFRDVDLGYLRNTPWSYTPRRMLHAHAVFPSASVPTGKRIFVFGDSFSEEVGLALVRSGLYADEDVEVCFNRRPPAEELLASIDRADLVLFVYSSVSLSKPRVLWDLSAIAKCLTGPQPR